MSFCNVLVCVVADFFYLLLDMVVLQCRSCYLEQGLLIKGSMFFNSCYVNRHNNNLVTLLQVLECYEWSRVYHFMSVGPIWNDVKLLYSTAGESSLCSPVPSPPPQCDPS